MVSRSGALLAALALSVAAVALVATLASMQAKPSALAQVVYEEGMSAQRPMLARWVGENHGAYWGNFDCHRHGWDLDWDEPAQLASCAGDTPQCIKIFKSCLMMNHPPSAPPTPEDCWCYHDAVELGCPPQCADEIFESYGQLSRRCHHFNIYNKCFRMFAIKDFYEQDNELLPVEEDPAAEQPADPAAEETPAAAAAVLGPSQLFLAKSRAVRMARAAPQLKQTSLTADVDADNDLDAADGDVDAEAGVDLDADAGPDPEPPADVDAEDEPAPDADPDADEEPAPLEPEEEPEEDPAEDLQFRQPAGTYWQQDNSATLIEPWQFNSPGVYEPREDPLMFDDDDPRE